MASKSERIPIAGTRYDLRAKLTQDERNAIIILTEKGYSQRKLAAMFRVSRRLVQHLLKPQLRTKAAPRTAEYWAEAKRKYRQRKHDLYTQGLIRPTKKKSIRQCKN